MISAGAALALAAALVLSPRAALETASRDAATVAERVAQREALLRRRLAALYRLSRGGLARALAESQGQADLSLRLEAARRIVRRDLDEIEALRRERADLERMRADLLARLARLERGGAASPLDARRGRLAPPAAALPRASGAGLAFRAARGAPVRAVGEGRVVHVGPIAGFGLVVLVDHGGGLSSVYAQLADAVVGDEEPVAEGSLLGRAGDRGLYFELRRDAEVVDAAGWLAPPRRRPRRR